MTPPPLIRLVLLIGAAGLLACGDTGPTDAPTAPEQTQVTANAATAPTRTASATIPVTTPVREISRGEPQTRVRSVTPTTTTSAEQLQVTRPSEPTTTPTPVTPSLPTTATKTSAPAATARPTSPSKAQTASPTTTESPGHQFGPGGLAADLKTWASTSLPQFITASHIDISDVASVSRFRSAAGHDFSDSFETCCSMKHYFHLVDFYGTRFTQPIYSAVDGFVFYLVEPSGPEADAWKAAYVRQTGKTPPSDYRDWNIIIRPDAAPNVWITHMHLNPIDQIIKDVPRADARSRMMGTARPASPGYRVKAGDLIGYGLGEIIIKRHLDGNGVPSPCNSAATRSQFPMNTLPGCKATVQMHSVFEFMTDEVFAEYQKLANVVRSDFIVSAEERASNPLLCDGESFVERANEDNKDHFVWLQTRDPSPSQSPAQNTPASAEAPVLPDTNTLASGRKIVGEFTNSGTQTLGPFSVDSNYVLAIAADGGPINVAISDGSSGTRGLYSRPANTSGMDTYATPALEAGQITISVTADEQVNWRLILVLE